MTDKFARYIIANKQILLIAFITVLFAGLLCMEELFARQDPPPTPPPIIPPVSCNCYIPPFVASQAKPNILVILDNSNSMDENFYGGAVGSFSAVSKSEVARTVLRTLITETRQMLRIGLMTYKLPTNVQSYYIHNSPYFASYDISRYCPNPPTACTSYCADTSRTADGDNCSSTCVAQNSQFVLSPGDEIITAYSAGSATRQNYCRLIYPKTKSQPNPNHPSDNNSTIYYKYSLPFYAPSSQHIAFCYSSSYNSLEGTPWDSYACYGDKTGSSDLLSGYSSLLFTESFSPTDSDIALGFKDFGRRLNWYDVGRTWYSNTSPGTGKLHVSVNDIADFNGTLTTSYTSLMNELRLMDGNSTRYMSCTETDKNNCSYIVNAGLTPTAGTLQAAYDYFFGTSSPIQSECQNNFIIYVTDGLPSVNASGVQGDAASLMPTVNTKLDALRTLTKGTNTRGVKTFILGMGLTNDSRVYLDEMADHGNTTIEGHAYYADDPEEFVNALRDIFGAIVLSASSATSVSILSEKTRQGANLIQAVFYPSKLLDALGKRGSWLGYLYDYWLHISRTTTTIREDTVQDYILNLVQDYVLEFGYDDITGVSVYRYRDGNGDGAIDANETVHQHVDTVKMDETKPLWEAGKVLSQRSAASRIIYTVVNTPSAASAVSGPLVPFNDGNSSAFTSLMGSPLTFDACLGNDNSTRRTNLVNYVRGTDTRNTTINRSCRNRTFTDGGNSYTWKLGDIVYSTPQDVIDYKFCYDSTLGFDNATCTQNRDCSSGKVCKKKESVIFAGANDGMLHAFKTGIINNEVDAPKVASLWPAGATDFGQELWGFIPKNSLPYLRWLAAPGYCHLSYVDLSPFITTMTTPRGVRKILIGGMRFGGAPAPGTGSAQPPPCDTCGETVTCSNLNTCYNPQPYDAATNPGGCTGLSSYYALDITNPEKPEFLWEFTHPNLGYTYSGPAVITRNGKYHVMFLSGPTGLDGSSTQHLYAFILTLNPQNTLDTRNPKVGVDMIESLYVWDSGSSVKNAIGGRLFTTGLDINGDGNTDFVFFGESDTPSGKLSDLKGGVVRVYIDDDNPVNWDFTTPFLNLAKQPITAKIETAKCFDKWYLFLGSGRYFTTADNYPSQQDFIMAVPFTCTDPSDPSTCPGSINDVHGSATDICDEVSGTSDLDIDTWSIDLAVADTNYYKERLITDPTVSSQNMVFFTTTQPYALGRICDSGGRTRLWGLNCATGEALTDTSCAAAPITDTSGTIYLQTSTGTINKIVVTDAFTAEGGKASEWLEGIPPETSTPFVGRYQGHVGKIMHWIEK